MSEDAEGPRPAATIYDVAARAGVNPSTVSRALSKPGRVSAATEARIRRAAEELDFRVNPIARALLTGRTRTIGLVVADATNPAVFGIVRGAEEVASAQDYTLVIAESRGDPDAEVATTDRLLLSVDGLILATTRLPDERIRSLAARKPVVLVNRRLDGVDAVLPDVESGVTALVAHLDALGHRSVVYLAGAQGSWISERRWAAVRRAAAARSMSVAQWGPHAPTIDGGRALAPRILDESHTAVVAFNDLMAIGAMQAVIQRGAAVPGDVSIAGFDDIFGSEFIVPALTTVRTPFEAAGRNAAGALLQRFDGVSWEPELLGTELIVRDSTGPRR